MAPVTRSMRAMAESRLEDERAKTIVHELRVGLSNVQSVVGREYKKYMVYALFNYICAVKEDLYLLGTALGYQIDLKLKELVEEAEKNIETDTVFLQACLYYKFYLREYLEWVQRSLGSPHDYASS